ncbi:MAG: 3-hydroxyacyl-CoA dehydrogenase NAD-binding domain-containing protein [Propionicimonas sp.]|nr:3-hydroxyacyl-CoA dehydrogenase NAD-binding domain-containing protein [Propionicimonas sp.]
MLVGVVGAGTMGSGIAEVFAREGFPVLLTDTSPELADRGLARIRAGLDRQVSRGRVTAEAAAATLAHLAAGRVDDLADRDLVVEAVYESPAAKRAVFGQLDALCRPGTIFASNTSSLSVTEMARGLRRPVVGMHFFNPVPVMRLVEVVAGGDTPPELVQRVMELAARLGKTPVLVNEAPGFVVNRILMPMLNEAVGVLAAGTASAADIDTAMVLGVNHPMGPLALADLIGLDVCLAILEAMAADTGQDRFRPHPLLRELVEAGRLGRKSGRGFHDYT